MNFVARANLQKPIKKQDSMSKFVMIIFGAFGRLDETQTDAALITSLYKG